MPQTEAHLRFTLLRWVLGLSIVVVPVITMARLADAFSLPKVAVIAAGSTLCALLLRADRDHPLWQELNGADRTLLITAGLFGAWLVLATAVSDAWWLSTTGTDARFVGLVVAGFPAVLLIAVPVAADTLRRLDSGAVLLAACLGFLSLYSISQWLGFDPTAWAQGPGERPVATLGNSNFVGGVGSLAIPLSLALWHRRPEARWAWAALLVIASTAVWLSEARLGLLAAATGGLLVLLSASRLPRNVRGWLLTAGVIGAPVVGLTAVVGGIVIGDRTGLARLGYWRATFAMWADNPVLGVGLGRFQAFHRHYRPPESVIESGRDIAVDSSHAWLFDLAATTGTPGALLWMAIVVAAGLSLRRSWLRAPAATAPLVAGVAGMLAAHGVQSSMAVPSVVPVWLGWLLLGTVVAVATGPPDGRSGAAKRPTHSHRARSRRRGFRPMGAEAVMLGVQGVLVAGLLAGTIVVSDHVRSAADVKLADALTERGRWPAARDRLEVAVARAPRWPVPWQRLTTVAFEIGDETTARRAIDGAAAADPRNHTTVSLAYVTAVALDGRDAGEPWIMRLRALDPNGLDSNLIVAAWALEVGDHGLAGDALRAARAVAAPERSGWETYETLQGQLDAALDAG